MPNKKQLYFLFAAICMIRLIITQVMGLMPQDAYYYFYSENLALSYFDHPPMVAYMLYLFTAILGKSAAVIKLADFVVTFGSLVGFHYLSNLFLSKRQALKTTLFYGATIMLTILSVNTTPDVPLIFFWTLTLIAFYKAIFEHQLLFWAIGGLLIGLSFDSKYTALFLLFGLFIFLIVSPKHRRFLFSKELLLTCLFSVIGILPVLLWNMENDWMSFLFQSSDRASSIMEFQLKPKFFLGNLGTQILILLPPLFGGLFFMLYKLSKKHLLQWQLPDAKILFLAAFSLPIIGFFFAVSLLYWVKLNWIMPGYIAAIILVGRYLSMRLLAYQLYFSLVFTFLFLIQIVFYLVPIKADDTWFGWASLHQEVETLKDIYPEHFIFSNDIYKTSAILNFYMEENIYAGNVIDEPAFQFMVVQSDLRHLEGQHALYIDSDKRAKDEARLGKIPKKVSMHFESVTQLAPILIKNQKGDLLRKFWVYECRGYLGAKKPI